MSLKVIYDVILGRLRQKDGDGGDTPTPPSPQSHFTVTTSGSNKTFYADEKETDTLTVTVTLKFDNVLVDADSTPSGWTRTGTGTYERSISQPGTIAAQSWSYTPGGEYGSQTATKSSASRTLTKVWPAYWGTYPSEIVLDHRLDGVVANLATQHRATSNVVNNVVNVPADQSQDVWLWVVTHGSATVVDNNLGANIMNAPENAPDFASPMQGTSFDLSGYKIYVSTWPAEAGQGGFGELKINITL